MMLMDYASQEFTQGTAGMACLCILVSGSLSWKIQRLMAGIICNLLTHLSDGWLVLAIS